MKQALIEQKMQSAIGFAFVGIGIAMMIAQPLFKVIGIQEIIALGITYLAISILIILSGTILVITNN